MCVEINALTREGSYCAITLGAQFSVNAPVYLEMSCLAFVGFLGASETHEVRRV
jgi:hypothetical protein